VKDWDEPCRRQMITYTIHKLAMDYMSDDDDADMLTVNVAPLDARLKSS